MFAKLVVLGLLGAGLFILQSLFHTAIQPEVASELALEQFANPSYVTDTASRGYDQTVMVISNVVWFIYIFGALVWLRKDIFSLFKKGQAEDA